LSVISVLRFWFPQQRPQRSGFSFYQSRDADLHLRPRHFLQHVHRLPLYWKQPCERFNQTIWQTIQLLLHGRDLPEDRWEEVLAEALHAVRSLVCLSTNETPHERLFRFLRRCINGMAFPSWLLTPGTVLLRRHVRNKGDPFCDPVELCGRGSHIIACTSIGWETYLSRNVDCCHDSLWQLAFVFHSKS